MLEAYPDESIEVYAVWFSMIPGDMKLRWKESVLSDERVRHYWDEDRQLGRWISEHVQDCEHLGPIDWDSYYLFDSGVEWRDEFPDHLACGTPILRATNELSEALSELFDSEDEDTAGSPRKGGDTKR